MIEQVNSSNTTSRCKKLCLHALRASSEEIIMMHSGKMKAKYMKKVIIKMMCERVFFVNSQAVASRNFIAD